MIYGKRIQGQLYLVMSGARDWQWSMALVDAARLCHWEKLGNKFYICFDRRKPNE